MERKYLIVFLVLVLIAASITFYLSEAEIEPDEQTEDTEFPQRTVDTGEEHVLTFDGETVDVEQLVMDAGDQIRFVNEDPSSHFIEISDVTGRTVMPETEITFSVNEVGEHTLYVSDIDEVTLIVE